MDITTPNAPRAINKFPTKASARGAFLILHKGSSFRAVLRYLRLHQRPGAREIGRGVDLDPEPCRVDETDRNAHPGFEGAQLLEPLALFEDSARQCDKPVERGAAIGVEPDMLVMRPLAPRHRRLREIERAGGAPGIGKPGDHLVDAGRI